MMGTPAASDNADREVRAVVDARNTLAAEVRRLREQAANDTRAVECPHVRGDTSKWCDLAETEVSRLREEVDTLRADQAPGQEGHQRVCVPLVAERDALRREIRHFIAEVRRLADENIDLKLERDALRSIVRRYRTGHHVMYGPNDLYAWVHPDEPGEEPMTPAEVAALAAHNPQDGTDG